jgi:hypothetical protein
MANKTVGRPPKYTSKEEVEGLIAAYFKSCEGEILKNDDGTPILNKHGQPVIINQRPPTVTGLALALGFSTRQGLLNYQGKKEFLDTITRAKSKVEQYTEERLFDRDGVNGAKFSLTNNFSGWSEKVSTELDKEEQKARINQIHAQIGRINRETSPDQDEGVEIINDAPKEADPDLGDHHTEVSPDL